MEYKRTLNHIKMTGTVIGSVQEGADPKSLKTCASFTLAVRNFKRYFGAAKPNDFQKVVCWGRLAEKTIETIKDGSTIVVIGDIYVREYVKAGKKYSYKEVVATEVIKTSETRPFELSGCDARAVSGSV